ncbi:transglutaminase family protein [Marinobacter sp. JSM 1782161]|uniref:transglutaminase family protein n=1 Tax=Marinobacter sp. JSM 1782161 TaxID=2685906 RepID=UPI001401C3E4|nr:transglutaminase family protein [Marinobacter sp. JSM 1782161]
MKYRITHLTRYTYEQDIANSYNRGCLLPRSLLYQKVESSSLEVTPTPSSLYSHPDYFGNLYTFFHVNSIHHRMDVKVTSQVEVMPRGLEGTPGHSMPWEDALNQLEKDHSPRLLQARMLRVGTRMAPTDPELAAFARDLFERGLPLLEGARRLTHRIFSEFTYDPEFTTLTTPVRTVLEERRGVCQDFAHLAISALRSLGIPAGYVSGYLETLPPPGKQRLVGADASHAWFSVFDPSLGWVDFDPTNDLMPDERHITVAYGRDYADVVPLKGLMSGGGRHDLHVEVDVMPLAGRETRSATS